MEPKELDAIIFFKLLPQHISVLDYQKGFGHTDLVSVSAGDIAEISQSARHQWLIPLKTSK